MGGNLGTGVTNISRQFVAVIRVVGSVRPVCELVPLGSEDASPPVFFERPADPTYTGEEIDHREICHARQYPAARTESG